MGLSIPLLKHLLGAKGYGNFSIWFNGMLIAAAILSGWITQSVLRLYNTSEHKRSFTRQMLRINMATQIIVCIPILLIVWWLSGDIILAIMFTTALFVVSFQLPIMAVSQSGFLSKKNIYSEIIRATTYISIALLLLYFTQLYYLYTLFVAIIFSYLFSVLYLRRQINFSESSIIENEEGGIYAKSLAKQFLQYGAPLSLWFVFSYNATYIDKLFVIKNFGMEAQGNYQAIFDLLSRTLMVVISPIVTSLFPLLTLAYKRGEVVAIKQLIRKIILIELVSYCIVSLLYWWFGADLVFWLLKTEHTNINKWIGFWVITGTFIWLIAVVFHKKFELKMQSWLLLLVIAFAFLIQLVLYLFLQDKVGLLLYPVCYTVSGFVYIGVLLVFDYLSHINKRKQPFPMNDKQ